jgi:peroxiredoxin
MIGRATVGVVLLGAAAAFADPEPAPEFAKVTAWINSDPVKLADLKGRVVVVHFRTHGCINCMHNYPHYKKWAGDFKGKDVTIVGVHTPETEREKDVDRIRAKLKENGLTFAVAVDNSAATWAAWRTRYWPTVFVVDRKGNVRFHWEGELGEAGEAAMKKHIDDLLAEGK